MNLKHKAEALLFSSGRRMSVEELSNLCKRKDVEVQIALEELMKDYQEKNSSLEVVNENRYWKITIKDEHLPLVKEIVTKTELSKTLMETLAVIAFKYPIKQSELIHIRTNKAYDHLRELEDMGYITRIKHGRSKLIKLTEKFFDYFQLAEDELQDKFQDFGSIAKIIENKEQEIKKIKAENKKIAEQEKKNAETQEKEIDLVDDKGNKTKLEIVDEEPPKEEEPKIHQEKEKLGDLEIIDEPKEEETEETTEEGNEEEASDEGTLELETTNETKESDENSEGETTDEESKGDSEIDQRVEEMMHPKEQSEEETTEEDKEQTKDTPKEE